MTIADYTTLPYPLNKGVEVFSSKEDKDIYILSTITALSTCFPTYTGVYHNRKVHANLYSFIIAPAASGKGTMIYGKMMAQEVHRYLKAQLSLATDTGNKVKTPPQKLLFAPGNITSAAFMDLFQANDNLLIVESEADTIAQANGQKFGGFSDILRKAFQHEAVSKARALDNQYIEVSDPKLSVLISGTPNQLHRLIPSAEDGLFSRFIFLTVNGSNAWSDVSPSGDIPIADQLQPYADKILEYYKYAENHQYQFELTQPQWDIINNSGKEWLKVATQYGDNGASIAKRSGLMLYRVAMVLSILRHFEDGLAEGAVSCEDQDLAIALELVSHYFHCSLSIYDQKSKHKSKALLNPTEQLYYSKLPDVFTNPLDTQRVGKQIGISEKSARNYHNKLKTLKLIVMQTTNKQWRKLSNPKV